MDERGLEGLRRARELAADARGQPDAARRLLHRDDRLAQGHAGRQVERERHRREEALVVHLQRGRARLEAGEAGERARTRRVRGLDMDVAEGVGALPELGRHLHHHPVLVELGVDGGHLALPERAVERLVDEARAHPEAGRGGAIDGERHLQPRVLLVARDVAELGEAAQGLEHARGPLAQVLQPVGLQRVLVLRVALAPAHPDVLHRLEIAGGPGDAGQLRAQAGDHLVGGDVALAARLERDEHARGVDGGAAGPAAGVGGDGGHRGIARARSPRSASPCRAWPGTSCPGRPRSSR